MWRLSETEEARREQFQTDVRELIKPEVDAIHATGEYPRELYDVMGKAGMLGVSIPAEFGGQGQTTVTDAACVEELAKVSGTVSLMAAYVTLTALPVMIAGSDDVKQTILPRLCSGEWLGSYAITEPHAGSNPADMRTTAAKTDAGWLINGQKKFIGNAGINDVYVIFARTGDDGAGGISAFWLPADTPGIDAEVLPTMGLPGWHLGQPSFTDVEVGEDHLMGGEGNGFAIAMQAFDASRLIVAAQAVGLAQGAIDLAMDYALRRHTFGVPVIDHQGIQFKLAELEAEVAAARSLTYMAATMADEGAEGLTKISSSAKMFASDVAMRATTEAVQVLGGNGYLDGFPAERMMRDAKVLQIYEGTNEIQKLVIARAMRAQAEAREPLWADLMPGQPGIPDGT